MVLYQIFDIDDLSVFRKHNYITKTFIFTYFFIQFKFFLLQKNEDNADNKNHDDVWKLFLLIMLIVFYTAR